MDLANYLKRIDYSGSMDVTDKVLADLHQSHINHVPFENLDIYYKKIFDLNISSIYKKVVINRRGGFCYELNLLFNWFLTEIGFNSRIITSRIFNADGTLGPEFDHMSLYVKAEKEFLVDVGYGDLFITPIELRNGLQFDSRNYFCIDEWSKDEYLISMSTDGVQFSKRYTYSLNSVSAHQFDAICFDKQTNLNSYFVKNLICTRSTSTGRVTIFNDKFIEKTGDLRIEREIDTNENLMNYLQFKFGILIT